MDSKGNKQTIKVCETCKYFLINLGGIDCLNDEINQEEYERCLGENGSNCEGWKRKDIEKLEV